MRGLGLFKTLFKGGTDAVPAVERRERIPRVHAREGLRILIVDDSNTVVALLGRMLRQNGYETSEAATGEAAISFMADQVPELIFLDIVLPGMSGFAVLRALRRDPRTQSVPVIMISGNLKATEEFYGQRIGADDFMKKPFSRLEVFARIERLVQAGRLPPRVDGASDDDTADVPDEIVSD